MAKTLGKVVPKGKYQEHYDRFEDADFVKSSASPPARFDCVEIAQKDGIVALRSSRDKKKRTIFFDDGEWKAFLAGAKNGEFDLK